MSISKNAYIFTPDGKAVLDDGKQSGVILIGKNGTIAADVAAQYGVAVYADGEYEKLLTTADDQNTLDLDAARKAPFASFVSDAATANQGADQTAVASALQTAVDMGSPSDVDPAPAAPAATSKATVSGS